MSNDTLRAAAEAALDRVEHEFERRYPSLLRLAKLTEHNHGFYSTDAKFARDLLAAFKAGHHAALPQEPPAAAPAQGGAVAAPVGQVPRKPCDGCRTPSACRDEDYQYSACAPSERTVRVPDGLSQSDAQFWLDRRAQIIETCRAAGLTIVTTAQGVHAMRLGKVEAQARAAIPHPPAEGSQTK